MQFCSMSYLSNGGCERNETWHKGSLRDEDDAWTLNTRIAQRKRAIPHSMKHSLHNIIKCCNNTHQGAPHTGKETICTCIDRKLTEFATMWCTCNTSPKLILRTSVTVTLLVLLWMSKPHLLASVRFNCAGFLLLTSSLLYARLVNPLVVLHGAVELSVSVFWVDGVKHA